MNKEELKRQIKLNSHPDKSAIWRPASVYVPVVIDLIDEMDGPETLSQEWIESKTWNNLYVGRPFVYVDDIQNLLVPKLDEQEKPVVPEFVAKFYEKIKDNLELQIFRLIGQLRDGDFLDDSEIHEWANHVENKPIETLIRMKDGYTVEEKKYYVKEPTTGQFLIKNNQQSSGVKWDDGFSSEPESYTEKEIKAIDERFWPFVIPVKDEKE